MPNVTPTDIANLALSHIGIKPIGSIEEVSVPAEEIRRKWHACRREALRGHDWGFATSIVPLALLTDVTPPSEYLYAYAYPEDCVALWHVYNDDTTDKDEGEEFRTLFDPTTKIKYVATNCEDASGEFTYDLEDTTLYDANFVKVLSHLISSEIAIALTGDKDLAKAEIQIYNALMNDAERMSGYESYIKSAATEKSNIIDARG